MSEANETAVEPVITDEEESPFRIGAVALGTLAIGLAMAGGLYAARGKISDGVDWLHNRFFPYEGPVDNEGNPLVITPSERDFNALVAAPTTTATTTTTSPPPTSKAERTTTTIEAMSIWDQISAGEASLADVAYEDLADVDNATRFVEAILADYETREADDTLQAEIDSQRERIQGLPRTGDEQPTFAEMLEQWGQDADSAVDILDIALLSDHIEAQAGNLESGTSAAEAIGLNGRLLELVNSYVLGSDQPPFFNAQPGTEPDDSTPDALAPEIVRISNSGRLRAEFIYLALSPYDQQAPEDLRIVMVSTVDGEEITPLASLVFTKNTDSN